MVKMSRGGTGLMDSISEACWARRQRKGAGLFKRHGHGMAKGIPGRGSLG